MWNPRDPERAMYIYNARKVDKRTFADIGRELGISLERTRQMYRQLDWKLNGMNADHHQKKTTPKPLVIKFPIEGIMLDTMEQTTLRKLQG